MSAKEIRPAFSLAEAIREGLRAPSPEAFHRTDFYRMHGQDLEEWLRSPWTMEAAGPPGSGTAGRIRLVQWNIQQGKAWEQILAAIDAEPRLRDADLWSLNEVDIGMARSGNRNVAFALAEKLGLNCVFVANYLEMTKGLGDDRNAPGENTIGLHGNALLSRWPLESARTSELPECWDYFRFLEEKRYGCRRVLWATVRHPEGDFLLGTVHTEVRNNPRCRDRQIQAALAPLPGISGFLAGDWNTHTFRRGGRVRQAQEFLRILRTQPDEMDAGLLVPHTREPLLRRVEAAGFALDGWNEAAATARQVLAGVEELSYLPQSLARMLVGRYGLDRRTLRMRLDWIGVRGKWRPAAVWTLGGVGPEGMAASDHAPIGIEAVSPGVTT